jgi:GntR family transcriptional regulator, transcriptional repressor for pyruvate dehydrogenase complex
MDVQPVARTQLVDRVVEELQRRISLGTFPPGSRLPPERELMTALGVGRSTLREAVRILSHVGLLDVRQGTGTYVTAAAGDNVESLAQRLRRAQLLEVYEARRVMERELAALAAERRDADDLATMRDALDRRAAALEAGDAEAAARADIEFHVAVAAAGKNAVLRDLFAAFTSVLRPAITSLMADPDYHGDSGAGHEALYEAIRASAPERARRRVDAYVSRASEEVSRSFGGATDR